MRRSFFIRKNGACRNENPGVSRIRLFRERKVPQEQGFLANVNQARVSQFLSHALTEYDEE